MILTETFWKNGSLPGEDGEEALQANTMAYARHSENFGLLFRSLSLLVTLAFPKSEIWPSSFPLQLATERSPHLTTFMPIQNLPLL